MVLESVGAWSSVERGINAMVADGRITSIVLHYPGEFGDIFEIFEDTSMNTLDQIKMAVSAFDNFDLSSGTIVRIDGSPVHALFVTAS